MVTDMAIDVLWNQATKLAVLLAHANLTKKKYDIEKLGLQKQVMELELEKLRLELRIKELSG
jgi:hypothetical protein